jgi:hypothetical protein
VAPIGLGRNGAKVKLERGSAGFLKMRTGAVWSCKKNKQMGRTRGFNRHREEVARNTTCWCRFFIEHSLETFLHETPDFAVTVAQNTNLVINRIDIQLGT